MGPVHADSRGQALFPVDPQYLNDQSSLTAPESPQRRYGVPPMLVPPESEPEQRAVTMIEQPQCDPEARLNCIQIQQQTDELRGQLQRVESNLLNEQSRQQALKHSLAAMNSKVGTMSNDLNYWKSQVQRIDAEAEQQHRDDLQSLETISELISRLPRPSTAAAAGPSRR